MTTDASSARPDYSDRERRTGLIAAIVAISVAAAGFGHSIPLIAVLLEKAGASSTFIGLNSAIGAVSIILCTPFMPGLIKRLGVKAFMCASIFLMVGSYLGLYLTKDTIWWWFPLRFCFSVGASGLFAASEFWISTLARDDNRGAIIGIYGTCLALGFAMGPFLIELTGNYTALPFIVGMTVFASAALPIALVNAPKIEAETGNFSFFPLLRQAPATFLASAFFGGTEASIFAFLPIIMLDWGFTEAISARVVTAYALGAIGLQFLIGKYSDSVGRVTLLLGCTGVAVICTGLFPVIGSALLPLYALLFVWGACVTGLSTIGLAALGDTYKDAKLAAANTGYVFMYGVGALTGPAIVGITRDFIGNPALPTVLIVLLGGYFLFVLSRAKYESP